MSSTERLRTIRDEVKTLYNERYPVKESGVFTRYDWDRCMALAELVHGEKVLDIGIGAGQIFNVLSRIEGIEELVGIDIRWNKKLIRPQHGRLELHSIMNLPFEDSSFDTVSCMEVLEHLEILDFPKALHELRRVCKSTLVMTIPYKERQPVWHHDVPGGHRQTFGDEKLERFFPRAQRQFIPRGKNGVSWVMLVESCDGR